MLFGWFVELIWLSLLLLLLSRFSCVRLCVTPQMAAHQAPPSLGFSRQGQWSGLPFPSPVCESEKWKWSRSVSVWLFVTPWTTAYQAPPSMGFSRQEYWSGLPLPSLTFSSYSYIGRKGQKIRKLVIIDQVLTFLSYLQKVHGLASQVQLLQGLWDIVLLPCNVCLLSLYIFYQ